MATLRRHRARVLVCALVAWAAIAATLATSIVAEQQARHHGSLEVVDTGDGPTFVEVSP